MTLKAMLLYALGYMVLGAVITGPVVFAHGRRSGRASLRLDAIEARRILAGWSLERSQETPQVEPPRPSGYRGRRRRGAPWATWWQATAPARTHARVAAAMAGAAQWGPYVGVAVVRVVASQRLRLAENWAQAVEPIPVPQLLAEVAR